MTKYSCEGCATRFTESDRDIADHKAGFRSSIDQSRMAPGAMPAGQCNLCGSVVHEEDDDNAPTPDIAYRCDDCGAEYTEDDIDSDDEDGFRSYIHHINERVGPGEPMPAGQCSCGSLVHLVDADTSDSRIANTKRYDAEMNRLELAPNGDDYNAILEMLGGAPYRTPHMKGR